jgi:calcium-dependent protein kinase
MGAANCCSNNSVCYTSKVMDLEMRDENCPSTHTTDNKGSTLLKKASIFFDKKNFINLKNKSLFEDYEIKEKLGEGAYGCVYKALHKKSKLVRAVKAIKRKHVDEVAFNMEISILKMLDHPNIIRLFECYYDNNYYYMIEEYCSGGDLYDYIKRQRNFSEKKAASIINQLLSATNHLHSLKIIHRDLKPENIVFIETKSNDIFIKLIDFGTSIYFKDSPLTQELGTIYYIAPEVFKNNYNERADIWSCGIILYTMLCGHPPFRGSKEEEIKNKIIKGKVEFPSKEWNKVSKEAIQFVNELLTYEAKSRPNAEQALGNPWILKMLKGDVNEDNILGESIMRNLLKFHSAVTLQKASLAFIANQFGQNEDIKILKDEFDKIDSNKDGVLSREELEECLSKVFPMVEVEKKVEDFMTACDFNNDGAINFSEYVTVSIEKGRLLSEEMLKKAFNMFDIVNILN